MPLLAKRPHPALRLVHIAQQAKLLLIAVVSVLVLHHVLVEVKAGNGVGFIPGGHLFPELGQNVLRLVLLLEEGNNLADLVGNHVSVLILM